jgi:hypothetical protein
MLGLLAVLGALFLITFPGGFDIAPLWEGARGVVGAVATDPVYRAVAVWGAFVAYMAWRASR